MIRRTVARAFGGSSGKTPGAWPAEEAAGSPTMERFLRDIHRALEEVAAQAARPGGRLRLNRPETLPEGIEFALAGEVTAVRFLDTLLGFVRVIIAGREGETIEEILSLHPHAGGERPVWKPLAPPAAGRGRPTAPGGRRRTAFRFTSVADLANRYAAIASGARRA